MDASSDMCSAPAIPWDWTRDTAPTGSSLRGFQEIALLKALKNARGRDRTQIRREYFAAVTSGGARYFIHKVARMAANIRIRAVRRREPALLSLFRPPPTRRWIAEPGQRPSARTTAGGTAPIVPFERLMFAATDETRV